MERTYKLKESNAISDVNDPKVTCHVSGHLPILTLSSDFIARNQLDSSNTINNGSTNVLYINDIDGNAVDLTVVANINSVNRNNNLLLKDVDDTILMVTGINDVKPKHYNKKELSFQSYMVGGKPINYNSGETLVLTTDSRINKLQTSTPDLLLTNAKLITLSVPGMNIGSTITRTKSGTNGILYEVINTLEVLELDVVASGIDVSNMVLFTIYSDTIFHNRMRYVGIDPDIDKVYIPLL